MADQPHLRLRKQLNTPLNAPVWPAGVRPLHFGAADARAIHALLDIAFPGGLVAPFEDWYGNLTTDAEFDPALCIAAVTEDGRTVGFVQCWTSDFIKDLAVAPDARGKGIGEALLLTVFAAFAERGAPSVDLKVETNNAPARRLYRRLGMTEAPF